MSAIFALITLALIALKVLLEKGDQNFPDKLLLYSNDVPWLLVGILVTAIGYVVFFGFYVMRPAPSPRPSSFSRQVSEPRIPTYWASSVKPPSQSTTTKTMPSGRAAPPPPPPNPRVQRPHQPTEAAQPSADRNIPPKPPQARNTPYKFKGWTYDELKQFLNDPHTSNAVLASLNVDKNPRPIAAKWVVNLVMTLDFLIPLICIIPYSIYMFLMTGKQYREWSKDRRVTPETPLDIVIFVLSIVQMLFKGTIANWGKSVGLSILRGNYSGAAPLGSKKNPIYGVGLAPLLAGGHSFSSGMFCVDPDYSLMNLVFGVLTLITKVILCFWLVKYFFVVVMPINIAQAFLRGFMKWFVGLPGKFILHVVDSFIL
ncbi:hypothetical protein C7B61_00035 [filamentous cyanobacterium CCP1]|nr:hypothetical protein C7B61_00035 [filamentous cyanobacterium CCP1]